MPRFVLLEHTGAPDDPAGLHYDLLLEQGTACRTWRLAGIPQAGGPDVVAIELPPHRLAWLDHDAGGVSGGRGFARRLDAGTYEPVVSSAAEASPPAAVQIAIRGGRLSGGLVLSRTSDHWLAGLATLDVP